MQGSYLLSRRLWPTVAAFEVISCPHTNQPSLMRTDTNSVFLLVASSPRAQWIFCWSKRMQGENTLAASTQPSATQGWSIDPCYVRCGEMESGPDPAHSAPALLLWLRTRLTAVGRESSCVVGHSCRTLSGPARASWRDTRPPARRPLRSASDWLSFWRLAQSAIPSRWSPRGAPTFVTWVALKPLLSLASVSAQATPALCNVPLSSAFGNVSSHTSFLIVWNLWKFIFWF